MGNMITNYLLKKRLIEENDIEIYKYGEFVFLFNCAIIFFAILISYILNEVDFIIRFFVFFIPLRIFIGGFHCSSPYRCFIFSELLFASVVLLYKIEVLNQYINLFILVLTLIAGLINYKLNIKETKLIRIIVFLVYFLEVFIYIMFPWYNQNIIYALFSCIFLYYYKLIALKITYLNI